jgi:hypothetical protein
MRWLVALAAALIVLARRGEASAQTTAAASRDCVSHAPTMGADGHPLLPLVRTYDGCTDVVNTTYDSPRLPLIRAYDDHDAASAHAVPSVTLLPTLAVVITGPVANVYRAETDTGPIRVYAVPPPDAPVVLPEIVIGASDALEVHP